MALSSPRGPGGRGLAAAVAAAEAAPGLKRCEQSPRPAGRQARGMSRRSKVVLGLSVLLTAATVAGVHLKQRQDRQVGVPGPRGSGLGPGSAWRLFSSPFLPSPGPGDPPSPWEERSWG